MLNRKPEEGMNHATSIPTRAVRDQVVEPNEAGTKQADNAPSPKLIQRNESADSVDTVHDVSTERNEFEVLQLAEKVMDVLEQYFWPPDSEAGAGHATHWAGRDFFRGHATHWILRDEPVKMVLPAFPFKTSNADKRLGKLPDFSEFLGLSRLNQMCLDVRKVYEHGAEVTLASDGVVFNDLVLVDDEDVWNYGQAVREMVKKNLFDKNIKVLHAQQILEVASEGDLEENVFYDTINDCRDMILGQFSRVDEEMEELIQADPDSQLTYAGIKKFCIVDQANSIYREQATSKKSFIRDMASLALKVLARSEGFGALIRERLPKHIRLSIHPSSGAAKLSICLVPQLPGDVARAPWMSCIAVDGRGAYRTVHSKDVKDTHDLVYQNDRPWLFRERGGIYEVKDEKEDYWVMEHMYPSGLRVWPQHPWSERVVALQSGSPCPAVKEKLRELAVWQPVHVVGLFAC